MPGLPLLRTLAVTDYGMYPGEPTGSGLEISFRAGLTLVVGANGLGKTTLVSLIYRMLSGPTDIPGLDTRPELGNLELEARSLPGYSARMFGQRVVDGARTSSGALEFQVNGKRLSLKRSLSDLRLVQFHVNGDEREPVESSYQDAITELADLSSFADWILLLRYLVFYFDDRKALVWDATAQRQVLRALLLPPVVAKKWTEDERAILELDTRMRNFRAVLNREERELARAEVQTSRGADVRAELQTLEELQVADRAIDDRLQEQELPLDAERKTARLQLLRAEQDRESVYREVERGKLAIIAASFPSLSETMQFILSQIATEDTCQACGSHVPHLAQAYAGRLAGNRCVLCESRLTDTRPSAPTQRTLAATIDSLRAFDEAVTSARQALLEAEAAYESHALQISQIGANLADRGARIDALIRQLPPEEAALHAQRHGLGALRARVEEIKGELSSRRETFRLFVDEVNTTLAERSGTIKRTFDRFAHGFLLETCNLTWSPRRASVGQEGNPVDFPAFELNMTGSNFPSAVRRSGPEQVSESQKEFIDLAFRMALMTVASGDGSCTLVVDAPESSLDAVFVGRAADVLMEFASRAHNRMVVTSNLVDGALIPELLDRARTTSGEPEIVDLLRVAEPTAAVREMRQDYEKVRNRILRHRPA